MTGALGKFDPLATYSAAAEEYERASSHYWQFLSTRTVERLDLRPGQTVLDAACGTGPATIAAAHRVGPSGRVVGVDYAPGMLEVARRRVEASRAANVELVQGDMLALTYGPQFDAVVCVLGLFFAPDMAAAARALWSHVRPAGTLAVTTFGAEVWTPVLEVFTEIARRARPDMELILPWRRTEDPGLLAQTLRDGGVEGVGVSQETIRVPFRAEDWRSIVMGSALRQVAADLGPAADRVLTDTEHWAGAQSLTTVAVTVNYATAVKPR
jgi:ubiquinone/menaquinone biosynthesis C-methylase UbiE